jgi:hypothetical protein
MHGVGPRHLGEVALVVGGEGLRDRQASLELRRGQACGGRRPEQLDVDAVRLSGVDVGPGPVADLHALRRQEFRQRLQPILHRDIDGGA